MQFRLLGALEAGSGGTVVDLGPPKQRAVLAILLLHVGEIVSTDRLIDLLWGEEPPRTAAHSIQIYVSDLRKSLEPIAGNADPDPATGLPADTPRIGRRQFERLVQQGSEQPREARRCGRDPAALDLWRGPASPTSKEEFAQPYVHPAERPAPGRDRGAGLRARGGPPVRPSAARGRDPGRSAAALARAADGRPLPIRPSRRTLRNYDNLRPARDGWGWIRHPPFSGCATGSWPTPPCQSQSAS
jgi:hypothetical protein